jgi:hypothetical protein
MKQVIVKIIIVISLILIILGINCFSCWYFLNGKLQINKAFFLTIEDYNNISYCNNLVFYNRMRYIFMIGIFFLLIAAIVGINKNIISIISSLLLILSCISCFHSLEYMIILLCVGLILYHIHNIVLNKDIANITINTICSIISFFIIIIVLQRMFVFSINSYEELEYLCQNINIFINKSNMIINMIKLETLGIIVLIGYDILILNKFKKQK